VLERFAHDPGTLQVMYARGMITTLPDGIEPLPGGVPPTIAACKLGGSL
jgi:hypothetical protein